MLTLLLSAITIFHASAQAPTAISGTVVDAQGRPVAGARISDRWNCTDGRFSVEGSEITADANGHFVGAVPARRFPVALMAEDPRGRQGSTQLLYAKDFAQPLQFKLQTMVPVNLKVGLKQLPGEVETGVPQPIEIYAAGVAAPGAQRPDMAFFLDFSNAKGALRLPPGSYRLLARTQSIRYFEDSFIVSPSDDHLNLGTLQADASTEGMLFGHKLPEWHIASARGLPAEVKLSDFKGKWVLVEGWAYWCVPCVREGIPALIKFCNEHQADSAFFEAIAFHTYGNEGGNKVDSFASLDPLTADNKAKYWGGEDLPCPILLDRDDQTAKDWGIGAIPNVLLIDPNGVLVKTDDPYGLLESKIKEAKAKTRQVAGK